MELEITPEPTEAERLAIEAALSVRRRSEPSAWWWAGLRENIDGVPSGRAPAWHELEGVED